MVLAENAASENVGAGILEVTAGGVGLFPNPATEEVSIGSRMVDESIEFENWIRVERWFKKEDLKLG